MRRRLTGAAVLVALGVIFIPMILSGGRDEMPIFGSNIPDKPRAIEKLKSLELPKPADIPAVSDEVRVPVDERLPAPKVDVAKPVKEEAPKAGNNKLLDKLLGKDNKPVTINAWVVQVGSFSNRDNALELEKKLRQHKFAAFVEQVKNKDGSVYRVRVGPETQRDKAEQQMQAIRKQLKINGVVMSHP